jgi:hypothetical protein
MSLLDGLLDDGVEVSIANGQHQLTWDIGTGTGKLQFSVSGLSFQDVPNSLRSASDGQIVTLTDCKIKAVLTGDAQMSIKAVKLLK